MRRAAVLAASALLAAGCASGSSDQPSAGPAPSPSTSASAGPSSPGGLAWEPCGPDGFECSTVTVPLDETDPAAGTADLALTRLPAGDRDRRIGSLVVNPGGPGASAVGYLQSSSEQLPEDVRDRFDLVAFDPRGVGSTEPVRCGTTAELDRYFSLDPEPDDAAELRRLEQGTEALVAGCERRSGEVLPHVSTAEAALDLDRVRAALGDDRLTYLGYSYGTALGAAYLDRFPTRVRAMVLDGGLDPSLAWDELLAGQAGGFDRAFSAFLADCERRRCDYREAVDGDLGAAYDRLAGELERTPLPGEGARRVGPSELSIGVGAGLYDREQGWPAIAAALSAAEQGDGSILLALNDSYLDRTPDGYANVSEANLAVNCLDRPWPRESAPYVALAERVRASAPRFGPAIALSGLPCSRWPVPAVGRPAPVTGEGAPPVLVIGTTGDPATPYDWSVALADQLASGVLLTYRGDGHTVYRAGAPDCVQEPVDAYLLTGQAPAPRTC